MFNYIKVDKNNLMLATKIQMEIFPEESGYEHFLYTIKRNTDYEKYFLVYKDSEVIGITGLYSNEDINETNSIWLGWFGVLEKYRSRGYGRKILEDTINMAKDLTKKHPIKYFRLYTSEIDEAIALPLYDSVMDIKEYYNNEDDCTYDGTCLIYTKSLFDDKPEKWNNRFLNIKGIIEEQELGNQKFS